MKVTDELDNRLEWAHATGNSRAAAVVVDEYGPVYGEVHVRQEEPDRFLGGEVARMGMTSWQVDAELPFERAQAIYTSTEKRPVRFGAKSAQINYEGEAHASTMQAREGADGAMVAVVTFVGDGPITQHDVNPA